MTVGEALDGLRDRLAAAGVATPGVDAELLAAHVLGCSRSRLRLLSAERLPSDAARRLRAVGDRRASREPVQLIVGSLGFRHLEIKVRPGVFIPRPETEVLAGEAVAVTPRGGVVVEPCTGTGAVACAIASEAGPGCVVATDVSAAAVALARVNAAAFPQVTVHRGDLLDPVDPGLPGRVDVLVANPPYVAESEVGDLEPEVGDWDPPAALVAGPSGHEVSDRLVAEAARWLRPGGWLLLEVDERRAGEAARRASAAGLRDAAVVADLTGRDRVVRARRA